MDKSFAEAVGEKPFDWNKFLDDRIARKPLFSEEYDKATDLSAQWTSCACGNQCAIIPRNKITGAPLDGQLASLGVDFHRDICFGNWGDAKETLEMIEERSAVLIKEELAKLRNGN